MGLALGLEQSRDQMIQQLSTQVKKEFDESQKHCFENKYFYKPCDKLGEGAHASVYKCYLKQD